MPWRHTSEFDWEQILQVKAKSVPNKKGDLAGVISYIHCHFVVGMNVTCLEIIM